MHQPKKPFHAGWLTQHKEKRGQFPVTPATTFVPRTLCCIRLNSWHLLESWGAHTGLLVHHPPTCQHRGTSPTVRLGTGELKKNLVTPLLLNPLLQPPSPIYPLSHCLWHPQEMSLHKEVGPITRNFSFTHQLLCTAMTFYLLSYFGLQPSKTGKRSQQCPETLQDQTSVSQVQTPPALWTAHRAHPPCRATLITEPKDYF